MKLIKNTGSDRVIDELRQALVSESSLNRRVELNLEINRLQADLVSVEGTMNVERSQ